MPKKKLGKVTTGVKLPKLKKHYKKRQPKDRDKYREI